MPLVGLLLLVLVYAAARSGPFGLNAVVLMLTLASASTAWNLLAGYTGQISFASAIFFGAGAYSTGYLLLKAGASPWIGIAVGVVLAVAIGVLIGFPVFRLRAIYFSIATIALQQVAFTVANNTEALGGTTGLALPVRDASIVNLQFRPNDPLGYPMVALVLFVLTTACIALYLRGRGGIYARAIRDDEDAALALGVPVRRYKLFALSLSAALIAVSGGFYAMFALYVDPNFVISTDQSLLIAMPTIIGGLGTLGGPLLGAVALVGLQQVTRIYLSGAGTALDFVVLGAIVMVVAVRWPGGIASLLGRFGK